MTAWLWLALALALAPLPGRERPADPGVRRPVPLRLLQAIAAVAVGASALVVVGGTAGVLAAPVGAGLGWAGAGRLYRRPPRRAADPALPFVLDLACAVLRAGQPVATALVLVAPAAGDRCAAELQRVGRLLALGAPSDEAWAPLAADPVLGEIAAVARRSATSGARLAAAWEQTAAELRATAQSTARSRAHRAGALATAPLGLCFLPAFVCLAIVPVVVGIAATALGATR